MGDLLFERLLFTDGDIIGLRRTTSLRDRDDSSLLALLASLSGYPEPSLENFDGERLLDLLSPFLRSRPGLLGDLERRKVLEPLGDFDLLLADRRSRDLDSRRLGEGERRFGDREDERRLDRELERRLDRDLCECDRLVDLEPREWDLDRR